MSRFADPNDTTVVEVGACECPDTPHSRDTVTVRRQLGYAALGRIGMASLAEGRNGVQDPTATRRALLLETIVAWNFLGPDGEEVPVDVESIAALDPTTVDFISEKVNELSRLTEALPKPSGARSRGSSRASASPTQTTPARA